MKKIYTTILFLIMSCAGYADSSLSDINQFNKEDLRDSYFDMGADISEKYQAASKYLSKSSSNVIYTGVVSYETVNGVLCHVGWYSDGYIATVLSGTEEGKQIIFLNGSVVGISYDLQTIDGGFFHRYTWGKVYSYNNSQEVRFN